LNPTYAHVIRKRLRAAANPPALHCPLSHGLLERRDGYFYSRHSLLAYPVIETVPVLRVDKGISASFLDHEDRP
jgi:uncharacterized protein YbaR (Trm112 family)